MRSLLAACKEYGWNVQVDASVPISKEWAGQCQGLAEIDSNQRVVSHAKCDFCISKPTKRFYYDLDMPVSLFEGNDGDTVFRKLMQHKYSNNPLGIGYATALYESNRNLTAYRPYPHWASDAFMEIIKQG